MSDYASLAQKSRGLVKFVKIAYPDFVMASSPSGFEEPLLEKNRQACRYIRGYSKAQY